MENFIPFEKQSKKKKKEYYDAKRQVWAINPVTRKPKNSRAYDRNKEKNEERRYNCDEK